MVTELATRVTPDVRAVWAALDEVADPEIPVVSVVDLGIVHHVAVADDAIRVEILPTFVGCPAIEQIRGAIADHLAGLAGQIDVAVTYAEPWTSERISARGRRRLEASGFAPPVAMAAPDQPIQLTAGVTCPYCRSRRTVLENAFGPTLCRSIYYCTSCRQPFEQFKAV